MGIRYGSDTSAGAEIPILDLPRHKRWPKVELYRSQLPSDVSRFVRPGDTLPAALVRQLRMYCWLLRAETPTFSSVDEASIVVESLKETVLDEGNFHLIGSAVEVYLSLHPTSLSATERDVLVQRLKTQLTRFQQWAVLMAAQWYWAIPQDEMNQVERLSYVGLL